MPESRLAKTRAAYPPPDGLIWLGSKDRDVKWVNTDNVDRISTYAVDLAIEQEEYPERRGIGYVTRSRLSERGWLTRTALRAVKDSDLLRIKDIGKVRARKIREWVGQWDDRR